MERKAEKNGLRVEDAFAGLLIFDLMSCAIVRHVFPEAESPFAVMSELTGRLPFATYSGKHEAAACFFTEQEADIVFVQEARCLDEHPEVVWTFLPAFYGSDEFTAVLVKKDTFAKVENISKAVCGALSEAMAQRFPDALAEVA